MGKAAFGKAIDVTVAIGCLVLISVFTFLATTKSQKYGSLIPATIAPAIVFHALVVGTEMSNLKP